MDRLEAISIFVAVVDCGSLAGAARKLGLSPASVTRAVAQLENTTGERLLERTTRRFAMTEAGERHVSTYRSVLEELARLDSHAQDRDISGNVVMTAPELFGRMKVMPVVESFLTAHPRVQVRVLFLNRIVDLVGEGVDIAVRLADLPDSSMSAVKIGEVRRLTCAAPSYLAERSMPSRPAYFANHWCIGLNEAGAQELWPYRESATARRVRSLRVTCRIALNSAGAAIEAAERGMGIVRPLSYQVERQIADGAFCCPSSRIRARSNASASCLPAATVRRGSPTLFHRLRRTYPAKIGCGTVTPSLRRFQGMTSVATIPSRSNRSYDRRLKTFPSIRPKASPQRLRQ
ncbi:LysR family transcriptional regulator [Agrobacterium rosae]